MNKKSLFDFSRFALIFAGLIISVLVMHVFLNSQMLAFKVLYSLLLIPVFANIFILYKVKGQ